MANQIVFFILAAVILVAAVFCVFTKKIMRAATALLFVLFGVAGLYFVLDYTYLGAAQISIYAGGITMVYIFAIQLVSKRSLQGFIERLHGGRVFAGALIAVACMAMVTIVFLKNKALCCLAGPDSATDVELSMEKVGQTLMGADKYQYVLPFEFISIFLLACIIGGLVISKKNNKEEQK